MVHPIKTDTGRQVADPAGEAAPAVNAFFLLRGIILTLCLSLSPVLGYQKVALVLSGGGARGLAQIGVLKALEENGIRPQLIVGTSMGAIVGGLYASGYSADSIRSFAKQVDWNMIFTNSANRPKLLVSQKAEPVDYLLELRFDEKLRPMLPQSISFGQQFYDILAGKLAPAQYLARENFDSLQIPLRIVTTDIITGRRIVISRGNLALALRASSGIPLGFSPIASDSFLLMDGGLTANIPVEPAIETGADFIIAVDVTSPMWRKADIDNPVKLVDQIIAIGITRQKQVERSLADWLITPSLAGFANTDFRNIDSLIERGRRATLDKIDSMRTILGEPLPGRVADSTAASGVVLETADRRFSVFLDSSVARLRSAGRRFSPAMLDSLTGALRSRFDLPFCRILVRERRDSLLICTFDPGEAAAVVSHGNRLTSPALIDLATGIKKGNPLRSSSLPEAMGSLYSTGLFNTVNVDLDTLNRVRVSVDEKKHLRARMGVRFDEFHLLEGYVEPAYENLFGWGVVTVFHLQYGLRREKYAVELQGNHVINPSWANNLQLQAYISREQIVNKEEILDTTDTTGSSGSIHYEETSLRKEGLRAMIGTQIGRFSMLEGGIKFERFQTFNSSASVIRDPLGNFRFGMRYFMLNLRIDNLDKYPFPLRGHQDRITLGGAHDAIGGTESFVKLDASASSYFTPERRSTINPRFQLGWASNSLPDVERMFIGGVLSEERYGEAGVYNYIPFIGLAPRAMPADIMALLHLEYRYSPLRDLYLSAAIDWAHSWDEKQFTRNFKATTAYGRSILESSPLGFGLGIAYNTVVGPLRFSWGRLLIEPDRTQYSSIISEDLFYFSAGHDF